jgi:hypothetical protein
MTENLAIEERTKSETDLFVPVQNYVTLSLLWPTKEHPISSQLLLK